MLNKKNNGNTDDKTEKSTTTKAIVSKTGEKNVPSTKRIRKIQAFATPRAIIEFSQSFINGFQNHWVNGCWKTKFMVSKEINPSTDYVPQEKNAPIKQRALAITTSSQWWSLSPAKWKADIMTSSILEHCRSYLKKIKPWGSNQTNSQCGTTGLNS